MPVPFSASRSVIASLRRSSDRVVLLLSCAMISCLMLGCGSGDHDTLPAKNAVKDSAAKPSSQSGTSPSFTLRPADDKRNDAHDAGSEAGKDRPDESQANASAEQENTPANQTGTLQSDESRPGASLWNSASSIEEQGAKFGYFPRRTFDETVLKEFGIRHLSGPRLDLYTDVAPSLALDELPHVFELAHTAWCEFFNIDPAKDAAWKMNGFVMADRNKFIESGLLPADLPAFANAYCRDFEFWMDEKPTDYYRRHLALHEGTHGFMLTHVPGTYPEWFFEGMAEFLGTHKFSEDKLTLAYYPPSSDEVPMLGRIKLLQEGFRAGRMYAWQQIMTRGLQRTENETEYYAWVWGWCALMNGIDAYRDRFLNLYELRNEADFPTALARQYKGEWAEINDNWQVFVSEVDYNYDFERNAIQFAPGQPLDPAGQEVEVAADRGWQSTGIRLEAGKTYEVKASGRYVMFRDTTQRPPVVWESEPQGIAIEYYNGLPIGTLQGVLVADDRDPAARSPFLNTEPVRRGGTHEAGSTGTLYLRINDHPAKRGDNSGSAKVQIREVK